MPMHDWTRVDASLYQDFHLCWTVALSRQLNTVILPTTHYAMLDHTAMPGAFCRYWSDDKESSVRSDSVLVNPPTTSISETAEQNIRIRFARRRIAIREARTHYLAAVIEIVLPSNKLKLREFTDLIEKSVYLLRQGVSLLIIDPFPPTSRDLKGLHSALWKELTGRIFDPPTNKPLTLASYTAGRDDQVSAFVEPLAVGDPIIDMPLFLTPEMHVRAPLAETYETAWSGFPAPLRPLLEGATTTG